MTTSPQLSREVLNEDFQIIRVTLETIASDVRRFSHSSADALAEALSKLEQAHRELQGGRSSVTPPPADNVGDRHPRIG